MADQLFNFESQQSYVEYSKKYKHYYSHGIQRLLDLSTTYYDYAIEQAKQGRNVFYTQSEALSAYAVGAIPIVLNELGRLGDRNAISSSENHYLVPKETCTMVEVILGEFYLHRNEPVKKVILSTTTCEALNMGLQLLPKDGYQVHIMQGVFRPYHCDEERIRHKMESYKQEILRSVEFITDGKIKLDKEKLRQELIRNNRISRKIEKIIELRIEKPRYLKSLAFMYLISGLLHYFGRPEEYEDVLDEIIEEMSHDNPDFENDTNVIPLVWQGGRSQEFSVFDAIDEANGAILAWAGLFQGEYDEEIDPLEALARHSVEGMVEGPLQKRKKMGFEEIEKINAKGVILYDYVGCTVHNIAHEVTRNYLKKKNIPALSIIGQYHVGKPSGQILTRVNAFMEMLE